MIVNWKDVNWVSYLESFGVLVQPKHKTKSKIKRYNYINAYTAFDIETSTIWLNPDHSQYDVHSFMYVWQWQIEDYTIIGRTWDEFTDFQKHLVSVIDELRDIWELKDPPLLLVWDHNLSFEFAFLASIYPFENEECFFRDIRKPIYVRMYNHFEFRCSYIQTNMSLKMLCKEMKVPQKLSGQKFDYAKVRFPWTELTDYELQYIITDVESLVMAMKKRVAMGGDTLLSVPITSTGYVRRDLKEALKPKQGILMLQKPMKKEFMLLRECFRGGNTHSNRQLTGRIWNDVYSYDIASSYPTQLLTHKFPMEKFTWLDFKGTRWKKPGEKMRRILMLIGLDYAVAGRFAFKHLRLKDPKEPIPYISYGKCQAKPFQPQPEEKEWPLLLDNGRVLEAGYLEIALTEIDLKIIMDQYYFDEIDVQKAMYAKKGYLFKEYCDVIMNYYTKKTALKGAETDEEEYMYVKMKNLLNAIYGCCVTNPINSDIKYNHGDYLRSSYDSMTDDEIDNALRLAPFPYQVGVWCTSLARLQLQRAIDFCKKQTRQPDGNCKLLYCDTDSVKVAGKVDIDKLNAEYLANAKRAGAFADDRHGVRHYIGLFEQDAHYERFITQGAKRYAYEKNGKLGVTVSGVSKEINEKTGVPFASEELGELENFGKDMTWRKAGGTMAVYNDFDNFDYTDPETGGIVHIGSNVSIVESTYKMTFTKDYTKLLENIKLYGQYKKEFE